MHPTTTQEVLMATITTPTRAVDLQPGDLLHISRGLPPALVTGRPERTVRDGAYVWAIRYREDQGAGPARELYADPQRTITATVPA
jgi:hypothetical protein